MRKILSLLFFLTIAIPVSNAQKSKNEKNPIVQFLTKRGYTFPETKKKKALPDSLQKWPDTLYYNTVYKAKLLGSPTIPISFSRIEYINGTYQVSPTLSVGYGYTWLPGDFMFYETDNITADPS